MRRALASTAALTFAVLSVSVSPAARADDGGDAVYSSTGVRTAGMSAMYCSRYPSGRDINVTRTMYKVASARHVSSNVMQAMFSAGWVESRLNNLRCGDRDSVGIFQFRPSMGWGTRAQCLDVTYQVNKWINVALPKEKRAASPGILAQQVERSAYPYRYNQALPAAKKYLNEAVQPYGAINTVWQKYKAQLGAPQTVQDKYTSTSQYVRFANGIVVTSSAGTYAVWGDTYKLFASGGVAKYGLPSTNPMFAASSPTGATGTQQRFAKGAIYWSTKTGAKWVVNDMQRPYHAAGGTGRIGFPTAATVKTAAGYTQSLEKATIAIADGKVMVIRKP